MRKKHLWNILILINVPYFFPVSGFAKKQCIEIDSLRKIILIGEVHGQKMNVNGVYSVVYEVLRNSKDTIDLYLEMPKSEEVILDRYFRSGKIIHYDYPKTETQLYPCFTLVKFLRLNLNDEERGRVKLCGIDNEYDLGKIYSAIFEVLKEKKTSSSIDSIVQSMQFSYDNFQRNKIELLRLFMELKLFDKSENDIKIQVALEILSDFFSDGIKLDSKIVVARNEIGFRDALMMVHFKKRYSAKNMSIVNLGYMHIIQNFEGKPIGYINFYEILKKAYPTNLNTVLGLYSKSDGANRILKNIYSKEVRKLISNNKKKFECIHLGNEGHNNINSVLIGDLKCK